MEHSFTVMVHRKRRPARPLSDREHLYYCNNILIHIIIVFIGYYNNFLLLCYSLYTAVSQSNNPNPCLINEILIILHLHVSQMLIQAPLWSDYNITFFISFFFVLFMYSLKSVERCSLYYPDKQQFVLAYRRSCTLHYSSHVDIWSSSQCDTRVRILVCTIDCRRWKIC